MKTKIICCFAAGLFSLNTYAQVFWNANPPGNILTGIEYLGSNAGAFPLEIKTIPAQPINFLTNNIPRMTIIGTNGFVGIGLPAPLYPLDVQDNINVNTTGFLNGYRINGFTVLQIPGVENTFCRKRFRSQFYRINTRSEYFCWV